MNINPVTTNTIKPRPTIAASSPSFAPSLRYRERDFGIGYGTSSGYADGKRYTSDWGAPRFRCS